MMKTASEWTQYIQDIQKDAFLVGPLQDVREIPEGFDITPTRVVIDVAGETFWVGKTRDGHEERGLGKSAIERLAGAAAASVKVTRTDDRTHPRRCEYHALAVMRLLDGSMHYAEASRAYDMTEDGTDWISIFDAAAAKAWDNAMKSSGTSEDAANAAAREAGRSAAMAALGAMHRNAESKARLRALRTLLGIRSKYLRSDLERKHFMVLRLSATGRSSDPALRQEFARLLFSNAIGATNALFGPTAAPLQARALPGGLTTATNALPAPQTVEDDLDPDVAVAVAPPPPEPARPEPPAAPPDERPAARPAAPTRGPAPSANVIGKGSAGAGKAFDAASDEELEGYIGDLSARIDRGEIAEPGVPAARAKLQRAIDEMNRRKAPY